MEQAKLIKEITPKICEEFIQSASECFGDNLSFAFIFGGLVQKVMLHILDMILTCLSV